MWYSGLRLSIKYCSKAKAPSLLILGTRKICKVNESKLYFSKAFEILKEDLIRFRSW